MKKSKLFQPLRSRQFANFATSTSIMTFCDHLWTPAASGRLFNPPPRTTTASAGSGSSETDQRSTSGGESARKCQGNQETLSQPSRGPKNRAGQPPQRASYIIPLSTRRQGEHTVQL